MDADQLIHFLEKSFLWASIAAAVAIVVVSRLTPKEAHGRLKVAAGFLAVGALLMLLNGTKGRDHMRDLGSLFVGVSFAKTVMVFLFDGLPFFRGTSKIFRDIGAGVVYFLAFLVSLRLVGVQLDSILTTSALLTAVLGFALQDTLGNLAAGLAMQAQRPFAVGDWVQLEGQPLPPCRVLEINWRVTKVWTLDRNVVSVPNSVIAKGLLMNFSQPSDVTRRSIFVSVGYEHAPDIVCETLREIVATTPGVIAEPPVSVITKQFGASGIQYWIRFFIEDFPGRDAIEDRAWTRIWYALRRAGLDVPYDTHTQLVHTMSEERSARERDQNVAIRLSTLRSVDFLNPLPADELRLLAENLRVQHFASGEVVIRQGEVGASFFMLQEGQIQVEIEAGGATNRIATLGAGDFFGEMSLLTGAPRTATCRAEGRVTLYEIDKDHFAGVLLRHTEMANRMSAILAERQLAREQSAHPEASDAETTEERSTQLLGRIRRFFGI